MIISLPNTLSVIVALSRDGVLRSYYRDFDLQSGWLEKKLRVQCFRELEEKRFIGTIPVASKNGMLETMNGESLNITEEKLARLREVVPEAFAEGEIDWEKLRVSLGGSEFKDERYHLNWAGKTGAFRALQSPTTATLAPCGGGGGGV